MRFSRVSHQVYPARAAPSVGDFFCLSMQKEPPVAVHVVAELASEVPVALQTIRPSYF